MASKIAANPTSNLFALLSDDAPEPSAPAPKAAAPKPKAEKKPIVGEKLSEDKKALTPAEKSKLRDARPAKPARGRGQAVERPQGRRGAFMTACQFPRPRCAPVPSPRPSPACPPSVLIVYRPRWLHGRWRAAW